MSVVLAPVPAAATRRAERPAAPAALVAIVDINPEAQRLLSATLFALGCRIMAIDCQADSGGAIAVQVRAGAPDVVVWQLGPAATVSSGPLLSLLASGSLADAGIVVVTTQPDAITGVLTEPCVQVLASPFTAVMLMEAVKRANAARPPDRRTRA